MAWPPTIPPNTRADATDQAVNHPDDHNKISNALTDVVNYLDGAWATYTPSLFVSWTKGNGVTEGFYKQIGKLWIIKARFTVGSTTVAGDPLMLSAPAGLTGSSFDLNYSVTTCDAKYHDASGSTYLGRAAYSSGWFTAYVINTAGTYAGLSGVSSTVPVVPANGDYFAFTAVVMGA